MILRFTLLTIIIGIAYLSITPTDTLIVGNDKISHFIAYSVLMTNVGLLTYLNKKRFLAGALLSIAYGAIIEVIQHYVPGRFMSGYDILANTTGVLLGVIITFLFHSKMTLILRYFRIIKS